MHNNVLIPVESSFATASKVGATQPNRQSKIDQTEQAFVAQLQRLNATQPSIIAKPEDPNLLGGNSIQASAVGQMKHPFEDELLPEPVGPSMVIEQWAEQSKPLFVRGNA